MYISLPWGGVVLIVVCRGNGVCAVQWSGLTIGRTALLLLLLLLTDPLTVPSKSGKTIGRTASPPQEMADVKNVAHSDNGCCCCFVVVVVAAPLTSPVVVLTSSRQQPSDLSAQSPHLSALTTKTDVLHSLSS